MMAIIQYKECKLDNRDGNGIVYINVYISPLYLARMLRLICLKNIELWIKERYIFLFTVTFKKSCPIKKFKLTIRLGVYLFLYLYTHEAEVSKSSSPRGNKSTNPSSISNGS